MAWLKAKNLAPWTRVLSYWTLTSKRRLRELQTEQEVNDPKPSKSRKGKSVVKATSDVKVASYTSQFPQILETQGWTLVS